MTKRPANLLTWLEHHYYQVGVRGFYIRVEETPELATLFESEPWRRVVFATFVTGRTNRDCGGQVCTSCSCASELMLGYVCNSSDCSGGVLVVASTAKILTDWQV